MINLGIFSGSKKASHFEDLRVKLTQLGRQLDPSRYTVVYGGGTSGVMGIVPSIFAQQGGQVLAIDWQRFTEKFGFIEFGETQIYERFDDRQSALIAKSDVVLVLPGGIGTLSELFHILTLNDIGVSKTPVIIFNYNGIYDDILRFIKDRMGDGYISNTTQLIVVQSVPEILCALETLT